MDEGDGQRNWQVGHLSRLSGVTVRALHHYDNIGILTPRERSEAGYRLYGAEDLKRLTQIVMMRRLGLSLTDVAATFNSPNSHLAGLLERHLGELEQRLAQQLVLRTQIASVLERMTSGQ